MADTADNPLEMLHTLRARLSEAVTPLGLDDIGCDIKLGRDGEKDVMIVAFAINPEVVAVDAEQAAADAAAEALIESFKREMQADDLNRREAQAAADAEAALARLEAEDAEEAAEATRILAELDKAIEGD